MEPGDAEKGPTQEGVREAVDPLGTSAAGPVLEPPSEPAQAVDTSQYAIAKLSRRINWLGALNVLVAISTLVQTVFSYRALTLASEGTRLDQRAWIGVQRPTFPKAVGLGEGRLVLAVQLTNYGRSPALHVTSVMTFQQIVSGLDISFAPTYDDRAVRDHVVEEETGTIHPGMEVALRQPTLFGIAPNGTEESMFATYLYGRVKYEDMFGGHHETTFCFVDDVRMAPAPNCGKYNSAN
jgi:hypothetical protein